MSSPPFPSFDSKVFASAPSPTFVLGAKFLGKKYALRAIVSRARKSAARDILE